MTMYLFADAAYPGDLHWFYDYTTPCYAGFAVVDDFGALAPTTNNFWNRTFCINR